MIAIRQPRIVSLFNQYKNLSRTDYTTVEREFVSSGMTLKYTRYPSTYALGTTVPTHHDEKNITILLIDRKYVNEPASSPSRAIDILQEVIGYQEPVMIIVKTTTSELFKGTTLAKKITFNYNDSPLGYWNRSDGPGTIILYDVRIRQDGFIDYHSCEDDKGNRFVHNPFRVPFFDDPQDELAYKVNP